MHRILPLVALGLGTALAAPSTTRTDFLKPWERVQLEQYSDEEIYGTPEEMAESLGEIRGNIKAAIRAAGELYDSQLAFFRAALGTACQEGSLSPERRDALLARCASLLQECIERDFREVSQLTDAKAGLPAWSTSPGRWEGLNEPALIRSMRESVYAHGDSEASALVSLCGETWDALQKAALNQFMNAYRGDIFTFGAHCNPFTREEWACGEDGTPTAAVVAHRAKMLRLMEGEQKKWEAYVQAMETLVCPCEAFRARATPTMMADYYLHLLDSRSTYLQLLACNAFVFDVHDSWQQRRDMAAAARPLGSEHPVGEIFWTYGHIFRHPHMDGSPWCIRIGAHSVLVLRDNDVLRDYLGKNPEGGAAEVCGYHCLECVGKPYPPGDDEARAAKDSMKLQPLFVLTEI